MNSFYMVLSSHASLGIHPANTPSHFINRLPDPVDLRDGTLRRWRVALTEIAFSRLTRSLAGEQVRLLWFTVHPSYTFSHSPYVYEALSPAEPPKEWTSADLKLTWNATTSRFTLKVLRPNTRVDFTGITALEAGFVTDQTQYVRISSEEIDGQTGIASPLPYFQRNHREGKAWNWQVHVYNKTHWELRKDRELVLPIPSRVYHTAKELTTEVQAVLAGHTEAQRTGIQFHHNPDTDAFEWRFPGGGGDSLLQRWLHSSLTTYGLVTRYPIPPELKLGAESPLLVVDMTLGLSRVLGFRSHLVAWTTRGEETPDMAHGMHSLYVYTNIAEPSLVGDVYRPLLRALVVQQPQRRENHPVTNQIFSQPYYHYVTPELLTEIEIQLGDMEGREMVIQEGETTVTLHFLLV